MAMAMSIHRTLCVLVSPENFTPRDVPSQQIRKPLLRADFNFLSPPLFLFFLKISLLEMLIAFGNEHLKIVNRAKKGVLHGTPKNFLKVSQDVFTMHNTQSTKINRKINFILHGLATRRLSVKKKVTRNRDFSRPAETDPYVNDKTVLCLMMLIFQSMGSIKVINLPLLIKVE